MLTVNLVCVGNLKEKFSRDMAAEYEKRLSAFCKLNILELKEQNHLGDGFVVLCDVASKQLSSENFASHLADVSQRNSCITFVIGGSFGVNDKVKRAANEKISFSQMTFPHNLFRIMLLEQIYRAFTILNGKTYHK